MPIRPVLTPSIYAPRYGRLSQEEEESLLGSMAGRSLSGLQYISDVLNKPHRAVTGLLAGRPWEVANILPFSGALGITDESGLFGGTPLQVTSKEQEVTGRDLLRMYGMAGPQNTWSNFLAGLAVDVATDPLTLLTGPGAAFSKVGQIARAAGVPAARTLTGRIGTTFGQVVREATPEMVEKLTRAAAKRGFRSLAEVPDVPLGGLIGYAGRPIGTGPGALRTAEALTKGYEALRYSAPGRTLAAAFQAPLRGRMTKAGQVGARAGTEAFEKEAGRVRKLEADAFMELGKLVPDQPNLFRQIAEWTYPGSPGRIKHGEEALAMGVSPFELSVRRNLESLNLDENLVQPLTKIFTDLDDEITLSRQKLVNLGFDKTMFLTDPTIRYGAPRRFVEAGEEAVRTAGSRRALRTGTLPADFAREDILRNIPATETAAGGTVALNRMLDDVDLRHIIETAPRRDLLQPASQKQIDALVNAGVDPQMLEGLTNWQATGMFRQMKRGVHVSRIQLPPKGAIPRIPGGAQYIFTNYLYPSPEAGAQALEEYATLLGLRKIGALDDAGAEALEAIQSKLTQAAGLTRWVEAKPLGSKFSTDFLSDHLSGMIDASEKAAFGQATYRALASNARAIEDVGQAAEDVVRALPGGELPGDLEQAMDALLSTPTATPEGTVRMMEALKKSGLSGREAILRASEYAHQAGAISDEVLGLVQAGEARGLIQLNNLVVPMDIAADVQGVMGVLKLPDGAQPMLGLWDKLTNLLKGHLTAPFPAFTTRNLTTLAWQDFVSGGYRNPAGMYKNWKAVYDMLHGRQVDWLPELPQFKGMTAAQATEQLSALMFAHRVSPHGFGEALERLGQEAFEPSIQLPMGAFREAGPMGLGYLKEYIPRTRGEWNPLNIRGAEGLFPARFQQQAAGAPTSLFAPGKAGEKLNTFFEAWGRGATFLRELVEGSDSQVASQVSRAAHVPFDELTSFERQVMRRVVPFYTFSRHAIPYQLAQLANHPGGVVRQALRATTGTRGEFTPDRAVGSIQVSEDPQTGLRRYLRLDLPHETIDDVLALGPTPFRTFQEIGYRLGSQLHPAIKMPLETVTGQSFFQRGRPVTEQFSRVGLEGQPLINQLIMNSPLSRYLTTFGPRGQIFDTRKGVPARAANILTGLRFQDLDIQQEMDRQATESAMQLLREGGARMFEHPYFPEGTVPSPQEAQLLQLLSGIAARRKARRERAK